MNTVSEDLARAIWRFEGPPWRHRAACADEEPDVFFRPSLADLAIEICRRCPVRRPCLENELQADSHPTADAGVFGGTTPAQRRVITRQSNNDIQPVRTGEGGGKTSQRPPSLARRPTQLFSLSVSGGLEPGLLLAKTHKDSGWVVWA